MGSDADIVLWDPEAETTIRHADLHDGSDYSPYEGLAVKGLPKTVILRGKVMVQDGTLVGTKADGRYLPREKSMKVRRAG